MSEQLIGDSAIMEEELKRCEIRDNARDVWQAIFAAHFKYFEMRGIEKPYLPHDEIMEAIRPYLATREPVSGEHCYDCDGLQAEISEIVRVARDNPAGLREFLQMNFPREWGLSREEHRAILSANNGGVASALNSSSASDAASASRDDNPSPSSIQQPVSLTQSDTVTNAWLLLKQCEGESMAEDRPRVDAAYKILERLVHAREPDGRIKAYLFNKEVPDDYQARLHIALGLAKSCLSCCANQTNSTAEDMDAKKHAEETLEEITYILNKPRSTPELESQQPDECLQEFERWAFPRPAMLSHSARAEAKYIWEAAWNATLATKRESGWQPIETAPKDGTRILGSDGQNIEVIYNAKGTDWFNQSAEYNVWHVWPPTHWMPLPPHPTDIEGERK